MLILATVLGVVAVTATVFGIALVRIGRQVSWDTDSDRVKPGRDWSKHERDY